MKKIIVITSFILMWSAILYAQPVTIKGKVSDSAGNGLPGASVVIKGAAIGSITDAEGNFNLRSIIPLTPY